MVGRANSLVRITSSTFLVNSVNKTQCPCITFVLFVSVTLILVLYFGELLIYEESSSSGLQISTEHIDLEEIINKYLNDNDDLDDPDKLDLGAEPGSEVAPDNYNKQEKLILSENFETVEISEEMTDLLAIKSRELPPASESVGMQFVNLQDQTEHGFYYQKNANIMNANSRYAVIVANRLTAGSEIKYTFNLPIACMAFIEIGYGCFIMIPYHDEGLEVVKAHNLISETLANWNKLNKALVIVMHIYVENKDKVVQFSQCSRLFVPGLVAQSCSESDAKSLDNVYLLTTDVDLLPLSTKMYHNNAYDWNLINPLKVSTRPNNEALYSEFKE